MKEKLIHQKALKMFLEGSQISEIARTFDVSRPTIYHWMDRFDWLGKLGKQQKKIEEDIGKSYQEIRVWLLKKSHQLLFKFFNDLQEDDGKITEKSALKLMALLEKMTETKSEIPENPNSLTSEMLINIAQEAKEAEDKANGK